MRAALAGKLRGAPAISLDDLGEGPEFALVMIRRTEIGAIEIIGEMPEDVPSIERAARKLVG